jgi:hypothetical protein
MLTHEAIDTGIQAEVVYCWEIKKVCHSGASSVREALPGKRFSVSVSGDDKH